MSGILSVAFVFCPEGVVVVITSALAIIVGGSMEDIFAHEDEFPLATFVVLCDELSALLIYHSLGKNTGGC